MPRACSWVSTFLKISQEALDFQLKTLYPVKTKKDPLRVNLLFLNHDRNLSTFLTVRYLVEHGRVADIDCLSRSMFESTIAMGLIAKSLIADDLVRYQTFQYIEIHKTYNHLKRLGLERLSGIVPDEIASLTQQYNDYLKRWGRNTSTWSGQSLEQNVRLVDSSYPPTCNEQHFYEYLYCQVYRKGSQSVHSSYGGLSIGVNTMAYKIGDSTFQWFKPDKDHLIFSSYHSLLVFLSSVRFLGHFIQKKETEDYFHRISRFIISESTNTP